MKKISTLLLLITALDAQSTTIKDLRTMTPEEIQGVLRGAVPDEYGKMTKAIPAITCRLGDEAAVTRYLYGGKSPKFGQYRIRKNNYSGCVLPNLAYFDLSGSIMNQTVIKGGNSSFDHVKMDYVRVKDSYFQTNAYMYEISMARMQATNFIIDNDGMSGFRAPRAFFKNSSLVFANASDLNLADLKWDGGSISGRQLGETWYARSIMTNVNVRYLTWEGNKPAQNWGSTWIGCNFDGALVNAFNPAQTKLFYNNSTKGIYTQFPTLTSNGVKHLVKWHNKIPVR